MNVEDMDMLLWLWKKKTKTNALNRTWEEETSDENDENSESEKLDTGKGKFIAFLASTLMVSPFSLVELPRSANVRVYGFQPFYDRRQKEHKLFVYGYAKFSTLLGFDKWWFINPPLQVEKKINFFLPFIAHVLRKKPDLIWMPWKAIFICLQWKAMFALPHSSANTKIIFWESQNWGGATASRLTKAT